MPQRLADHLHKTLLAAVIQQMPAGVIIAEAPSGRIILANEHVERIWRHLPSMSKSVEDYRDWPVFHTDGRPIAPADRVLTRTLRTGLPVPPEDMIIMRGDGSFGVLRVSGAPVMDEDDRMISAVVTFYDVTEERREREALEFIAGASAIVAESLDYDVTLQRIARLTLPSFADLAFVHLVDENGKLVRQEAAAADPEIEAKMRGAWSHLPRVTEPLQQVIDSGRSLFMREVPASTWDTFQDPEHRGVIESLGIRSAMTVLMASAGRVYGTMTFLLTRPNRLYEEVDLLVAEEIARRAAAAIERSRLFEAERRQRIVAERTTSRIESMQRLTSALAVALDIESVVDTVTEELRAAVGAAVAVVTLLDEDGKTVRLVGSSGLTEAVRTRFATFTLDQPTPIADATRNVEPVWVRTREEGIEYSPMMATNIKSTTNNAWAAIPLTAHGRTLGAIGLSFDTPQGFDEQERNFMIGAARQCAIALDRAQLFASERRAREEAEAASRAKDEFLAILSHELRTPLTSVIGWADLLRMTRGDDPTLAQPLAALHQSAKMQAKLIDDLLDVSRIVTGKLRIQKRPLELSSIVRTTVESQRPSAEMKGVALTFHPSAEPIEVEGDPDRFQQVFVNLIVNAIKFTPAGGAVDVRVARNGNLATVAVSDTGEGISPDFLPLVFDRFRQASVGDSRNYSGLGLGLSIVQSLVQLHGGTVHAASAGLGKGATFTVSLPVASPQ